MSTKGVNCKAFVTWAWKYDFFDINDNVNGLAKALWFGHWAPFNISFLPQGGKEIIFIKSNKDVLRMSNLDARSIYVFMRMFLLQRNNMLVVVVALHI